MKKVNNSSGLLSLLKTIFKPTKSPKKDGSRKRERWMYKNE